MTLKPPTTFYSLSTSWFAWTGGNRRIMTEEEEGGNKNSNSDPASAVRDATSGT